MRSIFSFWHFDLITTAFVLLLCFIYLYAIYFKLQKRSVYFFAGIILIFICTSSPLHFIGENYLFSAHMITHVLVLLIVAPLLVAGVPAENKFSNSLLFFSNKLSKNPLPAWICGVSIMWFWHVPYIFNHLMLMPGMNMTTHSVNFLMRIHFLTLLVAGIVFCWPLINPYLRYRIAPLTGVLYLSTACIGCSLLGLMITFAPAETYTKYIMQMDSYGYLSMIRNGWKISAVTDQQIAGLIMWVPCCFIYLTASMVLLIKYFENKEITVLKTTII